MVDDEAREDEKEVDAQIAVLEDGIRQERAAEEPCGNAGMQDDDRQSGKPAASLEAVDGVLRRRRNCARRCKSLGRLLKLRIPPDTLRRGGPDRPFLQQRRNQCSAPQPLPRTACKAVSGGLAPAARRK